MNQFLKNVAKVLSGNGLYQAVLIISLPFITKIYPVELYGKYAILFGASIFLSVASTFRYEMVIVKLADAFETAKVANLAFSISLAISFLCLFIGVGLQFFGLIEFSVIEIVLTVFALFFNALVMILNQLLSQQDKFSVISYSKVSQAVCLVALQLGLGLVYPTVQSLLLGYILGLFVQVCILFYSSESVERVFDFSLLRQTAKKYKDLPLKNYPSAVLNAAAYQGPIIGLGIVFGPALVAQYAIMQKCLNAPTSLIGSAISQPYYTAISDIIKKRELLYPFFKRINFYLIGLTVVAIPIGILLFPWLIQLFFGEKYALAGTIGQILILYYLVRFVANCQNTISLALNKLGTDLTLMLVLASSQLLPVGLAFVFPSITWKVTFVLMSVFGSVAYLMYLLFYRKFVVEYDKTFSR